VKTPVFTGSSVAIITPFKDGAVDYDKLARLIDCQLERGTDAITACGTTGEGASLSFDEHTEIVRFCVKRVNKRVPVIAGSGSNCTEKALTLSKACCDAGADALLIVTPYYNKTTQQGLRDHFTYIADRVGRPVILYNVPSRTGMTISRETYRELSPHPNINGVKEASGSHSIVQSIMRDCGGDLNVWCGNDDDIVPMMSLGAVGVISAAANVIPGVISDIAHACLESDFKAARALQIEYSDLIAALFYQVNPIPVKAAMNIMGLGVGIPRMPLCDLTEKERAALRCVMDRSSNIR
jgi:4-hydroxy-tetrahydrodipicolinate synthase